MIGKAQAAAAPATGIAVLARYGGRPGDQFTFKVFPPSLFNLKVPRRPRPPP
jgi:hypothetical protein